VRKSLPLLQSARMVDVVMVDPPAHSPERSDAGGAICMMLSRHGIKAEVSILSKTLPRVSEVLARYAGEHGCDIVVMGGYGHSRLREAVLGGVTRDLLTATTLPLLMAH
jgi:nucleotide-binding universal stress UspA family protein